MQPLSVRQAQVLGGNASEPTSVIEVSVVDAESGVPISGAKVELFSGSAALADLDLTAVAEREVAPQSPGVIVPAGGIATRTSRSSETATLGKVVFRDVVPGAYRLDVSVEGYISERQGQTRELRGGKLLNVLPASKTEMVLRLSRAGIISGIVNDINARAVPNLPVYLLLANFTVDGERNFGVVKGAITDNRGRFIISSISAGKYYLAAGRSPASSPGTPSRTFRPMTTLESYRWTYYPDSSDQAQAAFIPIAGNHVENLHLVVASERVHSVKGRIDFGTQTHVSPLASLYGLAPFEMAGLVRRRTFGAQLISEAGEFEFLGLPDGVYSLAIRRNSLQAQSNSPILSDDALFEVKVNGGDINDLNLKFSELGSVRGRIRAEDSTPLDKISTYVGRLQLSFDKMNAFQTDGFSVVDIKDGSFEMKGLSGRYRVSMPLTTSYIAGIWVGGQQTTNGIVEILPGFESNVEILLKNDGGSITGQIVDELSRPLALAKSGLLLASPITTPRGFYRKFSTSSKGQFKLEAIPPGNYQLFVWKDVDSTSYFDPALIQQAGVRATAIRVSPRSQSTAVVKIISQ
jgi:hypothetical protein